jgi:hypothetical protein
LASCRAIGLENEPTWSKSEKTITRTAFDAALGRELHDVIQEVKRMALEGRLFDKFVEKLSGDQYKHLIQTEPEFEARVNNHPFTPHVRSMMSGQRRLAANLER